MAQNNNNPDTSGTGRAGQLGLYGKNSQFNASQFLVEQFLGLIRTATLVQIVACTNDGGISPIGLVDVIPIINQMDGLGNTNPHGTIFSCCYVRVQGGSNAIIIDPQVGDIGVAVISDRDISSVKNSKAQGNPGSFRRFDLADGIYLFSVFGGTPNQYWQFNTDGMSAKDLNGNTITMASNGITINGVLFDRSQNITNIEEATSQSGIRLTQHVHTDVQTGGSNTGLPTG